MASALSIENNLKDLETLQVAYRNNISTMEAIKKDHSLSSYEKHSLKRYETILKHLNHAHDELVKAIYVRDHSR